MCFKKYDFSWLSFRWSNNKNNVDYKLTFRFVCNVYTEIYQICNRYKDSSLVYKQIQDLIDVAFNAFAVNKYLSTMETTEKL